MEILLFHFTFTGIKCPQIASFDCYKISRWQSLLIFIDNLPVKFSLETTLLNPSFLKGNNTERAVTA